MSAQDVLLLRFLGVTLRYLVQVYIFLLLKKHPLLQRMVKNKCRWKWYILTHSLQGLIRYYYWKNCEVEDFLPHFSLVLHYI